MKLPADGPSRPHPNILLPQKTGNNTIEKIADFCEDLRKKEAYGLGFIPAIAYTDSQLRGRMIISLENDEPCGFSLWAYRRGVLRIHQTAVVSDLRRAKHATEMVTTLLNQPTRRKPRVLRLRVADDLPANQFWQAIGCKIIDNVPGGKTWKRTINIYEMPIHDKMKVAVNLIRGNIDLQAARLAEIK